MSTADADAIQIAIEKLQEINGAITGMRDAPTSYPPSLPTARLPISIIVPLAGETNSFGGAYETQRDMEMRFYVSPTGQDAFDNPIQLGYNLLQRVIQTYLAKITSSTETMTLYSADNDYCIRLRPFSVSANPIRDTGILSDIVYTDETINFFGFNVTVGVTTEWNA